MFRNRWNYHANYDEYEESYPPYAAPYYDEYDDDEMHFYPYRRRYLPDGCAAVLAVVVVILAFVVLMLLTFHPQGFHLFHF